MAERFSDFASCESLSDETDNEVKSSHDGGFQKQGRRHKRKQVGAELSQAQPKLRLRLRQNDH